MVRKLWTQPEIYCISMDLPDNPLRTLNTYVIKTPEENLIIDTGFNRPECWQVLKTGLEELELNPAKTALFLTHLHPTTQGWCGISSAEAALYT